MIESVLIYVGCHYEWILANIEDKYHLEVFGILYTILKVDDNNSVKDESSGGHPMDMDGHLIEYEDPKLFQEDKGECGSRLQLNHTFSNRNIF